MFWNSICQVSHLDEAFHKAYVYGGFWYKIRDELVENHSNVTEGKYGSIMNIDLNPLLGGDEYKDDCSKYHGSFLNASMSTICSASCILHDFEVIEFDYNVTVPLCLWCDLDFEYLDHKKDRLDKYYLSSTSRGLFYLDYYFSCEIKSVNIFKDSVQENRELSTTSPSPSPSPSLSTSISFCKFSDIDTTIFESDYMEQDYAYEFYSFMQNQFAEVKKKAAKGIADLAIQVDYMKLRGQDFYNDFKSRCIEHDGHVIVESTTATCTSDLIEFDYITSVSSCLSNCNLDLQKLKEENTNFDHDPPSPFDLAEYTCKPKYYTITQGLNIESSGNSYRKMTGSSSFCTVLVLIVSVLFYCIVILDDLKINW